MRYLDTQNGTSLMTRTAISVPRKCLNLKNTVFLVLLGILGVTWLSMHPLVNTPETVYVKESEQADDNVREIKMAARETVPGMSEEDEKWLETQAIGSSYHVTHWEIQALEMSLPEKLLRNYRNPCWVEQLSPSITNKTDVIYKNNFFNKKDCFYRKSLEGCFTRMSQTYKARLARGRTWRLRCYPHYHLIGAPKSGSTDLYDYLIKHPHVVNAARKEPEFWNDRRFGKIMNPKAYLCPGEKLTTVDPPASVHDYIDLFDEAAQQILNISVHNVWGNGSYHPAVVGDHTPDTLFDLGDQDDFEKSPDTEDPLHTNAHILHTLYPDTRIILILRDPVERAFSQYRVDPNATPQDFHHHVISALHATHLCLEQHSERYCAYHRDIIPMSIRVGLYAVYVADWLSVFSQGQMLILRFEDYVTNPTEWVNKVWVHIGLDPISDLRQKSQVQNKATNSITMLPQTQQLLREFYKSWNKRLADLLLDGRFLWNDASTS